MPSAAPPSLPAPYTLFPLSSPLQSTHAQDQGSRRCYTAVVESRKRKRNSENVEIAAAIDGEGVNIYNVSSTKTISSYALHPTARFSCAPVSSVSPDKDGVTRRTYAATCAPKRELISWEERVDASARDETPVRHHTVPTNVVFMQDITPIARRSPPKQQPQEGGLLVIYNDGLLHLWAEGLANIRWKWNTTTKGRTTAYVASTSPATARKGLLKGHPTFTATFDEESGNPEVVLLIVTFKGFEWAVAALAITVGSSPRIRSIFASKLPVKKRDAEPTSTLFSVHFPSGTLYKLSGGRVEVYDLTTTVPSFITTLPIAESPTSLLRLSESSLLVASSRKITLYDTKFLSLQASISMDASHQTEDSSAPAEPSPSRAGLSTITLATHLSDLNLVIGHSPAAIIAIQLPPPVARHQEGSLLINSLCKGLGHLSVESSLERQPTNKFPILDDRLSSRDAEARSFFKDLTAHRGDPSAFDCTFVKHVGLPSPPPAKSITNGHSEDIMVSTFRPLQLKDVIFKTLRHEIVQEIIDMVFTPPSDDPEKIKISFFPPATIQYLLVSGNLSASMLPTQDALIPCLTEYDPTLRLLAFFIEHISDLPTSSLAHAIRLSLSSEQLGARLLSTVLLRLSQLPSSAVINALRFLPRNNLLTLIDRLQHDLLADPKDVSASIKDMGTVTGLLIAAVDAVGIAGALVAEAEEILGQLADDVSTVIKEAEGAMVLTSLLDELSRHVGRVGLGARVAGSAPAPARGPVRGSARGSARGLARGLARGPVRKPARGLAHKPARPAAISAEATAASTSIASSTAISRPKTTSALGQRRRARATAKGQSLLLAKINTQRRKTQGRGSAERKATALPLGAPRLRTLINPAITRGASGREKGKLARKWKKDLLNSWASSGGGSSGGRWRVEGLVV